MYHLTATVQQGLDDYYVRLWLTVSGAAVTDDITHATRRIPVHSALDPYLESWDTPFHALQMGVAKVLDSPLNYLPESIQKF